jgi:cytochrome c nitrite reductase small subunit
MRSANAIGGSGNPMRFGATVAAILAGALAGLGAYTFVYARGYSYFSSDPKACANCHVMQEHFDAWQLSPHHAYAACNDCHTPHALLPKYAVKAGSGWNHSLHFTLQDYPETIRIRPSSEAVLEANCVRCHADMAGDLKETRCVRCHAGAGHGAL